MTNLRVGSIVYATDQGLGVLAKSFYDNGVFTEAFVVKHPHHRTHDEWYPNAQQTSLRPLEVEQLKRWVLGLDVFLSFETPFAWDLFPHCKRHGVKTVMVPMYECHPRLAPSVPDLYICPSLLDLQVFTDQCAACKGSNAIDTTGDDRNSVWKTKRPCDKHVFLPVPVAVPYRQRIKCETFVHNAGHGSFRGRNGTNEVIEAWRHVKSSAKLLIRAQYPLSLPRSSCGDERITVMTGTVPYDTLWDEGDCFIFVEKFNGLSLPLQEAQASGMLVMAGDRFPMNTWLPTKPLIKPTGYNKDVSIGGPYNTFDEACYDPKDVASKVDEYYGRDISDYSVSGKEWAETMSWTALKSKWVETLEKLVESGKEATV